MKTIILTLAALLAFADTAHADHDTHLIQEKLNECGVSVPITGNFGEMTEAAVRRFQEERGLDPDGIVGPGTRAALFACRQVRDEDYKAPRVRRAMSDQEEFAQCGDDIISATVQRAYEARGLRGAIKAWEAEVRGRENLGLRYAQWVNATEKQEECLPTGVLTVVNCTVRARPCRAGN
jgi:hypothetical protein